MRAHLVCLGAKQAGCHELDSSRCEEVDRAEAMRGAFRDQNFDLDVHFTIVILHKQTGDVWSHRNARDFSATTDEGDTLIH